MANSNEAQTESPIPSTDLSSEAPVKNKKPKSASGFILILAAFALLLALYSIYATRHLNQLVNSTIDNFKQQQETDNETINNLEKTVSQSKASLEKQGQELDKKLQTAINQSAYQTQNWLLLKARYYLELAQINAHWSNDQQATIALLEQADALLATDSNQQLFPVRQTIAKEIAQLKALPKIDSPGLLSQLDAAQTALSTLTFKQAADQNIHHPETDSTSWQEGLKNSMGFLQKLVIIRRNDEDLKPLFSPLHQALVRDSIQLDLQEAKWAIMQNSSKIYQLALARALQNLKRFFDENTDATKALIGLLQKLQQEQLMPIKINIEQSLRLLNQLIEQKPAASAGGKTS